MDIDYDATEVDVDELPSGLLDYRLDRWEVRCEEHGLVERAPDGSAESHDAMIHSWAQHEHAHHGGNGQLDWDDRMMLIDRNS